VIPGCGAYCAAVLICFLCLLQCVWLDLLSASLAESATAAAAALHSTPHPMSTAPPLPPTLPGLPGPNSWWCGPHSPPQLPPLLPGAQHGMQWPCTHSLFGTTSLSRFPRPLLTHVHPKATLTCSHSQNGTSHSSICSSTPLLTLLSFCPPPPQVHPQLLPQSRPDHRLCGVHQPGQWQQT